jgi:hypothetical protein
MDRLLTPWRLRVYPRALFIPLVVPPLLLLAVGAGSRVVGGDLPAFYAAGTLVNEGRAAEVYDWASLGPLQVELLGGLDPGYLPFLYPPFVASAYSLLAQLSYGMAYVAHTSVMMGAVALSVVLLRSILPRVDRWPLEAFALAATFTPMYRAVTAGQNTAFALLVLVAGHRALKEDRPVVAGAIFGLLLYKPTFAAPAIGLLVLRHRRAALGVAATAAMLWAWSALVLGPSWVTIWLDGLQSQYLAIGADMPVWRIDLIGMAEQLIGHGHPVALAVGGGLVVVAAIGLMWTWWQPGVPLDLRMAALTCGLLLMPLHTLWYGAGLLILPFAILADRTGRVSLNRLTALTLLCLLIWRLPLHSALPIFAAVIATAAWVVIEIRRVLRAGSDERVVMADRSAAAIGAAP